MKKLTLVALLMLSAITVVPTLAEASGTEATGTVIVQFDAGGIAGLPNGDIIKAEWDNTGNAEIKNETTGDEAECTGGIAELAPSTRIDECVVTESSIVGINVNDKLAMAVAFTHGAPNGAPASNEVLNVGIGCDPNTGLDCASGVSSALSKLEAE